MVEPLHPDESRSANAPSRLVNLPNANVPALGTWVRARVSGWKDSRQGHLSAPLLEEIPLHVYGELESRPHRTGVVHLVGGHDVETSSVRPVQRSLSYPRKHWQPVPEVGDASYPWAARLRAHQSWYREFVLGLPPGRYKGSGGRQVDNWLPHDAVEEEPSLNFLLDDEIERRVSERLVEPGWRGMVDPVRLRRNLLSSQPLCFNLFGFLSAEPDALVAVLRAVVGIEIIHIRDVRLEWAPQLPGRKSGSAFDCFIDYDGPHGRRGFVGVECKYSENLLAQKPTLNPEYRTETEAAGSQFAAGAADKLNKSLTCQLWYNTCLALALKKHDGYDVATVVMLSCRQDALANDAVEALKEQLPGHESLVQWCAYEDIVDAAQRFPQLDAWASHFRTRYLDHSPSLRS